MRAEVLLWLAQRASAAVLGIAVLIHLATMSYAVRGGISAAEILARTRGSLGWLLFYGVFVLAVAVHVPIGLRTIAQEWAGWRGAGLDVIVVAIAFALLALGWRAVWAVCA
ncbi:MAG: succinate dehydrogenase [Betaproteobacteria bacterium]|nr:succinate dehydrogenase [Betaproteobacteria bacterium]